MGFRDEEDLKLGSKDKSCSSDFGSKDKRCSSDFGSRKEQKTNKAPELTLDLQRYLKPE